MIPLPLGTLPTLSYMTGVTGNATEAREALDVMRRSLARFGANNALREMLKAYGFAWPDESELPDAGMQEAVDSVARALNRPCERCRSLGYAASRPAVCTACRTGAAAEVSP